MKKAIAGLGCAAVMVVATSAQGAFMIEPNGKASGNFFATNGTGSSTAAGAGTLAAPGLTSGAASVFGGADYIYTYTPSADIDNTVFGVGQPLNSNAGLAATGATGGTAGVYNVYLTYPQSANNGGMPAIYNIDVDGDSITDVTNSYDQNVASLVTGLGIGLWELVGQITITDASQPVTLTITPSTTPDFVGVRTAGVVFEIVPEPATLGLMGLGGLAMLSRKRR